MNMRITLLSGVLVCALVPPFVWWAGGPFEYAIVASIPVAALTLIWAFGDWLLSRFRSDQ